MSESSDKWYWSIAYCFHYIMMDINLTDNVGAAEALENAKISALIIEYYKKQIILCRIQLISQLTENKDVQKGDGDCMLLKSPKYSKSELEAY